MSLTRKFNKQTFRYSSGQVGFTLVESMVAFLILTIGLIPALAVISSSNNLSALIRNNLIAANLAQEGVEIVRSVRDANWFANGNPPWDRFLHDCGTSDCAWRVQWDTDGPLQNLGTNPPLKFDSATGLYGYNTGVNTLFSRRITVSSIGTCDCELKVLSEVTWMERKIARSIVVESHLFNWK